MEVTYANTDIGIFAADWDIKIIAQLFDKGFQNGVFYEVDRKGKGVPIVNVSDLYGNIPIVTHSLEKFNATESEINRFLVRKGDLFFTRSSVVPTGIAMCNVYDGDDEDHAVFDSHVIKLSVDQHKINSLFLCLQCRMPYSRRFFIANSKTAIMTTIDQKSLAKCPIPIPSLPEQNDIVETLRQFDTYIENLAELIGKKRGIRDGALEDLMSCRTRLNGFTEDWCDVDLSDICKVYDGTHQTPQYVPQGIRFVSVENIEDIYGSKKYISLTAYESDFKIYPEKGDIFMTRIGDIGTPCVIETDEPLAYYVSLALLKNIKINSRFLKYYIMSSAFQKELDDRTLHHATPKKINKGEIGKCRVKYPNDEAEQAAIGSVLTSMDEEIRALETERDKMIQIREGAMDDLLTGRVRLGV